MLALCTVEVLQLVSMLCRILHAVKKKTLKGFRTGSILHQTTSHTIYIHVSTRLVSTFCAIKIEGCQGTIQGFPTTCSVHKKWIPFRRKKIENIVFITRNQHVMGHKNGGFYGGNSSFSSTMEPTMVRWPIGYCFPPSPWPMGGSFWPVV